ALCLVVILVLAASCTQVPAAPGPSATDVAATIEAAVAATIGAMSAGDMGDDTAEPQDAVIGTPIVQPTATGESNGPTITATEVEATVVEATPITPTVVPTATVPPTSTIPPTGTVVPTVTTIPTSTIPPGPTIPVTA